MKSLMFYLENPKFCELMFLIGVITSIKWIYKFVMVVLDTINSNNACK